MHQLGYWSSHVLILVLVEDTLEVIAGVTAQFRVLGSLNPCFNGRYPRGRIMMDSLESVVNSVLILVLVECPRRAIIQPSALSRVYRGLNPCFSGRYPRGFEVMGVDLNQDWEVLILVLVEDTLEALKLWEWTLTRTGKS